MTHHQDILTLRLQADFAERPLWNLNPYLSNAVRLGSIRMAFIPQTEAALCATSTDQS
jgi:hypothetical protein